MTPQYLERNALGFEGDSFLAERMAELCRKHKTEVIIETGTFMGATTKRFAEMAQEVYTCEINPENYAKAKEILTPLPNVYYGLSASPAFLSKILPNEGHKNVLFFLDAHWGPNNPLLEELHIIANNKLRPVIVIHDFKVPGHPELGFDTYGSIVYEWSYIKRSIESIYGPDGFEVSYNSEAEGAKRGVIFIEPK